MGPLEQLPRSRHRRRGLAPTRRFSQVSRNPTQKSQMDGDGLFPLPHLERHPLRRRRLHGTMPFDREPRHTHPTVRTRRSRLQPRTRAPDLDQLDSYSPNGTCKHSVFHRSRDIFRDSIAQPDNNGAFHDDMRFECAVHPADPHKTISRTIHDHGRRTDRVPLDNATDPTSPFYRYLGQSMVVESETSDVRELLLKEWRSNCGIDWESLRCFQYTGSSLLLFDVLRNRPKRCFKYTKILFVTALNRTGKTRIAENVIGKEPRVFLGTEAGEANVMRVGVKGK